jgi:RNA polymerase sigma-70 factor, ECF subfamily
VATGDPRHSSVQCKTPFGSGGLPSADELEEVFRRVYPALREKCRRMLKDLHEAEDVAQETFVRLWKSNLRGKDTRQMMAWAYRTSTRMAIDRLRGAVARQRLERSEELPPSDPRAGVEARAELEHLASRLPAEELELLLLQRWDGLTHLEIAEIAGRSVRTVRRILKRSENRLVSAAKEDGS